MAQKSRQNKLFAAEDFTVIYESYINANFQAFDYDTIRTAMVDYVRNNYPENYNDWVESAEFVSLLDVVAQFGHNLAYRVDMNARNNFLSTAERQESVYKLAEFLGYQPRRNVPAYGEMKVVSVKTNENVIGSAGTSLGGTDIKYEVSNNVSNLDDFITVVNSVMQNSNQYGSPKKSVVINNIKTEFYDLNNTPNQIKFDVQGVVSGTQSTFNVISSDYDNNTKVFAEKSPNPVGSFGIYFKNDGKGINSVNTGFFFGVKQGTLQYNDFSIDTPIDNASYDITNTNVNNSDVWVQNINSTGNVVKEWTKVLDVNSNVIYNNLATGERNVFSVKTRTDNKISVVFPDRVFGNIPKDTIRVWYRTSANSTYILRPDDITNKRIQMNYTGVDGNTYTAVFTIQLKQSVSTASSNETIDEIKENAPRNYASQDRMITAQDYNTMLGSTNGGIVKVKSINRTFSGHSRYSKFNDPTGTYSNLYMAGDDATLSSVDRLVSSSSSATESANLIYKKYVKNILDNDEFINLYYTRFKNSFITLACTSGHFDGTTHTDTTKVVQPTSIYTWNASNTTASGILNGWITDYNNAYTRVGSTVSNYMQYITPGALIKFAPPAVTAGLFTIGIKWRIKTVGTTDFTLIGAANNNIGTIFTATGAGAGNGTATLTTFKWAKVIDTAEHGLGIEGTGTSAGQPTGKRTDGTGAIVLDTAIESGSTIDLIYPALSKKFSIREQDTIIWLIKANKSFSIKYDYKTRDWNIDKSPQTFSTSTLFPADFDSSDTSWLIYFNYSGTAYDIHLRTLRFNFTSTKVKLGNIQNELEIGTYTKKAKRDIISILGVDTGAIATIGSYYVYGFENTDSVNYKLSLIDGNADSRPDNPEIFETTVGDYPTVTKSNINFQWEHIAADNQVVDPSFTNIIDVFALSKSYDTEYKNYLKGTVITEPLPPTSYQLGAQFLNLIDKKAISDTIVYKPVKYKPLFGTHAEPHLRARFRIIKLFGSNITDTDLKSKTVESIDEFFNSSNWDFGETFYFTELAAYVHKQLAGVLSSFVIVPQDAGSVFGDMFEYTPNTDELIIPNVDVNDIDIITNITDENIKAGS
jgi:hypothetical protein